MLPQTKSPSGSFVQAGYVGLAFLLGSASSACAATLIAGSERTFGGHTYGLLTTDTWTASEAAAVSLGAHLVTVNDILENNFIFDTYSSYGGVDRTLWIGLSFQGGENNSTTSWAWSSGDSVDFRNWWSGDPNGFSSEPAVAIVPPTQSASSKTWFDAPNGLGSYYSTNVYGVIEYSAVPEPAAFGGLAGGFFLALAWWRRRQRRGSPIKP